MSHTPEPTVFESSPPSEDRPIRRQIPSLRNRDVFAAVATGKTHEEVARQFDLTQPRVTQIAQQVREWSGQETRGDGSDLDDIQRLRLAEGTLRVQLDGWMRMAMQEWFRTCREGLGKPVFLNSAMRLSLNLARLEGVDISGKTTRLRAEEQARAEAELRRAQAEATSEAVEKPLWTEEQESAFAEKSAEGMPASTSMPITVCEEGPGEEPAATEASFARKNSYDSGNLSASIDAAASIGQRLISPTPAVPLARESKPVPKFLDKKVRKRLLAFRRRAARAEVLEAVG
jgi:hypothetical protein